MVERTRCLPLGHCYLAFGRLLNRKEMNFELISFTNQVHGWMVSVGKLTMKNKWVTLRTYAQRTAGVGRKLLERLWDKTWKREDFLSITLIFKVVWHRHCLGTEWSGALVRGLSGFTCQQPSRPRSLSHYSHGGRGELTPQLSSVFDVRQAHTRGD